MTRKHLIYSMALLLCVLWMSPALFAQASVGISVGFAPPPLPVYEQPICPGDGYIWTPGYWDWDGDDYYWVPGTWVEAPEVGYLWTPAWWGWGGSAFLFHAGYWGPHVGFYGGVNYGYGYTGVGFVGGRWDGNRYAYNRTVNNVNVTNVHNTYNETVINNVTVNKVSYNGGAGGIPAAPTAQERTASQESHVAPTPMQRRHIQESANNPVLDARTNGGHPAIAATPTPAAFNAPGVVRARGASAPGAGGQGPAAARFNNGNGAPPPGAQPNMNRAPPGAGVPPGPRFNNGNGAPPPGAQPNVNHALPPGAQPNMNRAPPPAVRPPPVSRPAAVPPPPKAQRPKPEGKERDHERGNR